VKFLAVFVVTACIDVIWTRCVVCTTQKRRWAAASWAAVLVLGAAFNTVSIVGDYRLAIPAALGAFVGTAWAVGR
jgi:hypothetical protein